MTTHRHHPGRRGGNRSGDRSSCAPFRSIFRADSSTSSSVTIPIACRWENPAARPHRRRRRRSKSPRGTRWLARSTAVVTGPIHKARMYEIGFEFPGPNRILRQPLRRGKLRHAADRRKADGCARHHAHSRCVDVAGSSNDRRDRARRFAARRIFCAARRSRNSSHRRRGPQSARRRIRRAWSRRNRNHRTSRRGTESHNSRSALSRARFLPTPSSITRPRAIGTASSACITIRV